MRNLRTNARNALRSGITRRCAFVASFLGVLASLQTSAHADPPVNGTLRGTYLARVIHTSIDNALGEQVAQEKAKGNEHPSIENVQWDISADPAVEVTQNEEFPNLLDVRANLVYEIDLPQPDVDITFQLQFACNWRDPAIIIAVKDFNVDVDYSWLVDVATGGVSALVTEALSLIVNRQDSIQRGIADGAGEVIPLNGLPHCPHFSTNSDADVFVRFDSGNQCQAGSDSHRACPANEVGSGIDQYCINGYWEYERDCECCRDTGGGGRHLP